MPINNTARLLEIRDGIVSELNAEIAAKDEAGAAMPLQFTADAKWRIDWDNQQLREKRVSVRPMIRAVEALDNDANTCRYGIEICVQAAISPLDDDGIDDLLNVANRIARLFEPNYQLATAGFSQLVVEECVLTVYDPAQLDSGRFFSKVDLTLKENSAKGI